MLIIKEEVKKALEEKRAVVALESTLIAHGLPYPENVEIGRKLEAIIREEGAIPATLAVIKGEIHVGLEDEELEYIAKARDVWKLSTREIPICVAQKKTGATTVSATSYIASLVGIRLFSTGGLGGVHRGVIETWDISRDLEELSQTEIIVVSSGAKSLLDLPKTVEYLETKGVIVVGYGTDQFPAFYTRNSGLTIPRVDEIDEIVEIYKVKKRLGIPGGIVVGNPIRKDMEVPKEEVSKWIEEALSLVKKNGITGKQVTPFLLDKIKEISNGKSVAANLALLEDNARVAAKIAVRMQDVP